MTKLNKKENQFINDNFGSEEIFRSFCKDHFQFLHMIETKTFPVNEEEGFSTSGEDGFTTGVVVQARYVEEIDRVVLYLLIDGEIRETIADVPTSDTLIDALEIWMEDPGRYTTEEILNFEFAVGRAVFVSVENDLSTIIKPLSLKVCEDALDLYEKVSAA